jgi:hypothetical protein
MGWNAGDVTGETCDLGDATVRELIMQLAEVEDRMRQVRGESGKRGAALARHERAIVAELHRRRPKWQSSSASQGRA